MSDLECDRCDAKIDMADANSHVVRGDELVCTDCDNETVRFPAKPNLPNGSTHTEVLGHPED